MQVSSRGQRVGWPSAERNQNKLATLRLVIEKDIIQIHIPTNKTQLKQHTCTSVRKNGTIDFFKFSLQVFSSSFLFSLLSFFFFSFCLFSFFSFFSFLFFSFFLFLFFLVSLSFTFFLVGCGSFVPSRYYRGALEPFVSSKSNDNSFILGASNLVAFLGLTNAFLANGPSLLLLPNTTTVLKSEHPFEVTLTETFWLTSSL